MRKELTAEKLQAALTGWVRVSDADVEQEFRKRNEKVKLDLAVFTATQFKAGIQPTDAELQAQFDAHTDLYKSAGEAARAIPVDRRRSAPPHDDGDAAGRAGPLSTEHPDLLHAGTDPREPHPVQDRGQRRGRGEEAGRGGARQGEGRRRLRRPGQAVLGGRLEQEQGRRPGLFRPRHDGQGVRGRGLGAQAGRGERPRQDHVRLPHHQAGRQEAGDHAHAGRGPAPDRGTAQVRKGAGRGGPDLAGPRQGDQGPVGSRSRGARRAA